MGDLVRFDITLRATGCRMSELHGKTSAEIACLSLERALRSDNPAERRFAELLKFEPPGASSPHARRAERRGRATLPGFAAPHTDGAA